jgi:uncharacterized protein YkwD
MAWAMRARLGLATASALALVIAAGVVHIIAAERSIEEIETAVARRVSAIRVEHMRPPLRTDPDLVRIAREYSCALLERVLAAGKQYRAVGENLASSSGAGDPVAAAIGAWMRSTGHRENILQPEFVETGVGACRSGQTYYFTQIFLRPAPSRR